MPAPLLRTFHKNSSASAIRHHKTQLTRGFAIIGSNQARYTDFNVAVIARTIGDFPRVVKRARARTRSGVDPVNMQCCSYFASS
jgi:hypothetical protein